MTSLSRVPITSVVLAGALLAVAAVSPWGVARAQTTDDRFFVHGRNVNTVGRTPPGPNPQLAGTPRHKQRNEASLDVSPSNPFVVLGANNDYRGVERFGDSWIGLFMSRDGGLTYTSRLLEGFPSTSSGVGAADPVVRTMPGRGLDDARIVVSSSRDGRQWSAPTALDAHPGRGHQIKPQAAVAGGRIQVNWIDTRNNASGSFDRVIADYRFDPATGARLPIDAPAGPSDPVSYLYRQMADVFGAQSFSADATGQPRLAFGAPATVSQYRRALVGGEVRQVEFMFINARMFQNGAVPFHGDYHAVSGQRHRMSETTPGQWIRNTSRSTSHAVFYSAFTDNRDVQGWVAAGPTGTAFTPAGTLQGEPGSETPATCDASSSQTTPDVTVWSPTDSPRSRYQNVYAAPTYPGLLVASPSGSKPTGTLERAHVIVARNLTAQDRTYRLTVLNQPADASASGRASFRQDDPLVPSTGCADGAACLTIDLGIQRGSSVTRTVYIRSAAARPRIVVTVQEQGGTQSGSVILNPDPDVAEIENPDGDGLQSILSVELHQPDILTRESTLYVAGLVNPDVTPVAGIEQPRIEYPRIE